jgi:uncharacterized protein YqhQ
MKRLRKIFSSFLVLQILPALESASEEALIGGQAVLEGVMMRSPHAWGIAVRKAPGEMATHCEVLARPSEKHKWMALPFIRGLVTLGQAMRLGYRALQFSSNVVMSSLAAEEASKGKQGPAASLPAAATPAPVSTSNPEEPAPVTGWMMAMNMVLSIGFFVVMYKLVPLKLAYGLKGTHWMPAMENQIVFNLVDGAIRLALFILFIWGISLFADIRRVFEYHGAEHKTVFAYEAQRGIPSVEFTQKFSTYHPRCGTSFLMTIMLISIVVYALFPATTFWARFALRIVFLPVIASVSYEMIRFSAKHGRSLFALLTRPGLWLQRITTKQCSDDQVECAIKALDEAMNLEKTHGGELVIA